MVYGREITDPVDHSALNSLIEFWLSSSSQRRDFELHRVHYKHPATLFGTNTKSSAVILALEAMSPSVFESSEYCGLFNVPEVGSPGASPWPIRRLTPLVYIPLVLTWKPIDLIYFKF